MLRTTLKMSFCKKIVTCDREVVFERSGRRVLEVNSASVDALVVVPQIFYDQRRWHCHYVKLCSASEDFWC